MNKFGVKLLLRVALFGLVTTGSTNVLADCRVQGELTHSITDHGVNVYGENYSSHNIDEEKSVAGRYYVEFLVASDKGILESKVKWVTIREFLDGEFKKYQCNNG